MIPVVAGRLFLKRFSRMIKNGKSCLNINETAR
jgi:hypothetical protein